ncbi:S-layer homology domain-containing protein [Leptolyngbya sp. BC1307]|uniref:S-layer homology domain-containing protein n=1 Tax=Leptolyngbya sp. BC1307 TaxID=2029589 RepID=UPI000EFB5DAB|nr:S-layer homology domain-containing protein [Leptolyngbya sp. BC1307]
MSLTSKLVFGLVLSLTAGLSASLIAPAILSNVSTNNSFASSFAQAQTAQAQTPPTQTLSFSDVSADYWAHDYIEGLAKSNIISGFGDGTFRPNDPVTRAQFAAILRQAFLTSQPTTAQAFKDVPAGYWATGAIAAARSAGFLSGYPDNTFKPNDRILRVQALVSLANGLKYPAGNPQSLSSYKDADTVPAYARPSTAAAAQANLIVSYPAPDQISPNRSASRAEVAAFVYQALVKAGRANPIAVKPERRWQITPMTTIAAEVDRMSLSENGQRLAAITDFGQNIKIWNTQTGSLLRTVIPEEPDTVFNAVAISKDGTKIAAIKRILPTGALQLTVQTVEDGRVLLTKSLNLPPETSPLIVPGRLDVVFSPDGKQVMTQNRLSGSDGTISYNYNRLVFQDIATGEVTQGIVAWPPDRGNIEATSMSPDGSLVAILRRPASDSSYAATVTIFQRNNNGFDADYSGLITLPVDLSSSTNMTFTNSNLLNLTTFKSNQTVLDTWNPQTGEKVQSTTLPNEECLQQGDILPSPDGTSYFSSYPNLGACLGNIQTGEFQRNLDGLSVGIENGVFSGDGDSIAVAGDREIRIFTKVAP